MENNNLNEFDGQLFKAIFNVSQDAIIVIDHKGLVVFWNSSAERIFGYSNMEMRGVDLHHKLMPKDYLSQFNEAFEGFRKTGEGAAIGKTLDLKAIHKNGNMIDIALSLSSLNQDGQWYAVGIARDVTEERRWAKKFKTLFDSMLEGVAIHELVFDGNGDVVNYRVLDVNQKYETILGIPKKTVIGQLATEIYDSTEAPYLKEYADVAISNESIQFETYFPPLKKHFSISVFSSGLNQFATVFQDITESKKVLQKLKQSEEQFDTAMNASQDGLYDWDLKTNDIYFSPGWKKMLGYEYDELPNTFKSWEGLTHPDDVASSWEMLKEHLDGKRDRFVNEFRMRHKEGHWVNVLSRATAIWDENGKPVRVVGTHTDISWRKEAEKELLEQKERLTNIIEGTNVGTWEWDIHTGETIFNKKWAELIGYTLDEISPMSYNKWAVMIHDEDYVKMTKALDLHFRKEVEHFTIEFRMRHKDGYWVWILSRGKVVSWTEDGKPKWMFGTHQEITEEKLLEIQLKESEERYRELIENISNGVAVYVPVNDGEDFIFREFNKKGEEIDGVSRDDLIGRSVLDVFPSVKTYGLFEVFQRVWETGKPEYYPLSFYSDDNIRGWRENYVYKLSTGEIVTVYEDVTGKMQAAKALEDSEARLRTIIETLPDLVWLKDPNGVYLMCNKRFENFFGAPESEIIGRDDYAFMPEEAAEFFRGKDRLALLAGKACVNEEDITFASDGHKEILETVKSPMFDSDGELIGVLGIGRDITDRKKGELELKESEERLKNLINSSPDIICFKDGEGRWLIANDSIIDLFQLQGVDLMNKMGAELPSCTDPIYEAAFAECSLTDEKTWEARTTLIFEEYIPTIHGDIRTYEVIKVPIFDESGLRKALVVLGRDITERKASEGSLQQLRQAIEQSPICVVITDAEGLVEYANPYFLQLTGYELNEVMGQKTSVLKSGEQSDSFYKEMWETIKSGKTWMGEFHNRKKDGTLYWENAIISPVKNDDGTVTHFIAVKENITEKKGLWEELISAKEIAESASQAKSEFLANMSHEIRTPLNGVIGFSELLKQTELNSTQHQYLENAHISAKSLLGIINDILDVSKIEAGQLSLEKVMTDMVVLLEESVDMVKYQAAAKGLELLLDIDPHMVRHAVVDPVRLKQVLVNLLSNAVKFTDEGEVVLTVHYDVLDNENGFFRFTVFDTGIGIQEESKTYLFKAFQQADASTTRKFGGTGLGLTISNYLVNEMGGHIQLQSEFGKGATFYFDVETEIDSNIKSSDEQTQGLNRVMIIDDNPRFIQILYRQFSHWGIEAIGCSDLISAGILLKKEASFDVILVDQHMPEKDGLDVIQLLQERKMVPENQRFILMLSAADDIAEVMAPLTESPEICGVMKPLKPLRLLSCLAGDKCLDKKKIVPSTDVYEVVPLPGESPVILIVEDVKLNMVFITELIQQLFPNVEMLEASNGEEAVSLLGQVRPDLVLMDIQMPVMDGLEATKQIRQMDEEVRDIPVIALTAGAFHSEREKCIQAGMDEFLTKPINRKALFEMLLYYLKPEMLGIEQVQEKDLHEEEAPIAGIELVLDEPDEDPVVHFDYETFKYQMGDDDDLCRKVIQMVPENFTKNMAELESAVESGEFDQIRELAHRVKGSSLNMCFVKMGELTLKMEKLGKAQEDMQQILSLHEEAKSEWEQVLEVVKTYLS